MTKYKSGQTIYTPNQPSSQFFLIVEGRVKISRISTAEVVVDVYQTDEFFETYFNRPGMTGIDPNLKPVKEYPTGAALQGRLFSLHAYLYRLTRNAASGTRNPPIKKGEVSEPLRNLG